MKRTMFGWLMPTMDLSDAKIYKSCGVDVLVYIRFLRICIIFFAAVGVLGIGVIVPFNYTAEPPPLAANVSNYLSCFSMANVPGKSDRLYVHLTAVILITLLIFYLIWRAYEDYFELRCTYQRKHAPYNYSVMCSEMRLLRGETLERRFDVMFPGQVIATHRTHVCETLVTAVKDKDYCAQQLARARCALIIAALGKLLPLTIASRCRESYQQSGGSRPQHWEGPYGPLNMCLGRRVDSIDFYSERIAALTQEITLLQSNSQVHSSISIYRSFLRCLIGEGGCAVFGVVSYLPLSLHRSHTIPRWRKLALAS